MVAPGRAATVIYRDRQLVVEIYQYSNLLSLNRMLSSWLMVASMRFTRSWTLLVTEI